ncbi:MAG TPA: 4-(cytidine 5'-diphospho)-2-C-methyl-D-erythritol kinase [Thermoleophilia bacterium]|nr:4-(cytidine 5'-diphospho)-2-C-methyl-D-erythritol kinase [Thermoleophilia bacterium]
MAADELRPQPTPAPASAFDSGPQPDRVEVAAPAKINLSLLVGPRRSDGFHEVFSLMLPVTLADLVTLRPAPDGAGLSVTSEVAPGEDNLAARLVRELERRLGRSFDVTIEIAKSVPAGAGLGGGSSDAAAALIGLERLYGFELPVKLRYEVASEVGSDVPFFLWPGPQLSMGRGTVLKDVSLPAPLHIVLALPGLHVATAAAYGWFDEGGLPERRAFAERTQWLLTGLRGAVRPRDLAGLVTNDLQAPVVARHPEIGALVERLREAGAYAAAMSGSGSSVFGLFASAASAQRALAALAPTTAVYATDLQPAEEGTPARAGGGESESAEREGTAPAGDARGGQSETTSPGGTGLGQRPPGRRSEPPRGSSRRRRPGNPR